jgi:hypothetical protein
VRQQITIRRLDNSLLDGTATMKAGFNYHLVPMRRQLLEQQGTLTPRDNENAASIEEGSLPRRLSQVVSETMLRPITVLARMVSRTDYSSELMRTEHHTRARPGERNGNHLAA